MNCHATFVRFRINCHKILINCPCLQPCIPRINKQVLNCKTTAVYSTDIWRCSLATVSCTSCLHNVPEVEISGSHGAEYNNACNVMWSCVWLTAFRGNILRPSSALTIETEHSSETCFHVQVNTTSQPRRPQQTPLNFLPCSLSGGCFSLLGYFLIFSSNLGIKTGPLWADTWLWHCSTFPKRQHVT
jgi:hypothetical protein